MTVKKFIKNIDFLVDFRIYDEYENKIYDGSKMDMPKAIKNKHIIKDGTCGYNDGTVEVASYVNDNNVRIYYIGIYTKE